MKNLFEYANDYKVAINTLDELNNYKMKFHYGNYGVMNNSAIEYNEVKNIFIRHYTGIISEISKIYPCIINSKSFRNRTICCNCINYKCNNFVQP